MIENAVSLKSLRNGQSALIRRITGSPEHVHRLAEFGLRGGTRIQMFRQGDPCILRFAGGKVCFRCDELLRVLVEVDPAQG